MSEEIKKTTRTISRREFLRDAGMVVGGTAVSSAFFLSACGEEVEVTKTVTTTAPDSTVTTTAPGATSTVTKTAADNTVTVTKYTCPVCNQEFDSLEALKAHYDAVHEEEITNLIKLTVNGRLYEVKVKPNETLQDTIRKQIGFTSPKDMCFGYGACGSCSVIVNGRPILSCMVLTSECDEATIETAEGIAATNNPLTESYVANFTPQCGYCTPGFFVTAKALLDHNPNPTEAEIREALAGNMCRCGTYPQHILAILEASSKQ
ncbi:MAG: 2Fe-2S iron-sulfur cluster-binding protein [Candidatus Cloacimonetes bacterium]|nr:2Fe-2S iron-sulfur cluster-binding protein [Candidatus Cloacimonadota bacterium]